MVKIHHHPLLNGSLGTLGGGGGGAGRGGNEGVGLQRGQGHPHHHRDVQEALRAPKARKLLGDTFPLGYCMCL